jgi:hypothetical protein
VPESKRGDFQRPAEAVEDHAPQPWFFTAVGLNGRTRSVAVDRLPGAVRLLTRADGPGSTQEPAKTPPLPHAFVWNAELRRFEPTRVKPR